ncbi:MAG: DUF4388 domain-containing protein, partial [Chloroflexota bacterium]
MTIGPEQPRQPQDAASTITLAGSIEGIGLPSIVRFLSGLQQSGRLHAAAGHWAGDLFLDRGQVVGASFGAERGVPALDAMVLALPNGEFSFAEGAPPEARNVDLPVGEIDAHLDRLDAQRATMVEIIPSLSAVPRVIEPPDAHEDGESVTLDRGAWRTLLRIDGRRTVEAICAERGVVRTLNQLARLVDVGLVAIDTSPVPPPVPPSSPPGPLPSPVPSASPQAPPEASSLAGAGATTAERPDAGAAPAAPTTSNAQAPQQGEAEEPALRYWLRTLVLA